MLQQRDHFNRAGPVTAHPHTLGGGCLINAVFGPPSPTILGCGGAPVPCHPLLLLSKVLLTLLCLISPLVVGGAVSAEEQVVVFSVDSKPWVVHVGEQVRAMVTVKHPQTVEVVWPAVGVDWKEAQVERSKNEPTVISKGRVTERKTYWLSSFIAGNHVLDTGEFVYRASDGKDQKITGPQIKITVESRLPKEWQGLDIRPIKPPVLIVSLWMIALIVTLAGALAFWIWRRQQRAALGGTAIPPQPAHEIALSALEQLRQENLPSQGENERYYVRLSGIVRAYIERRFRLRAPGMTTEEFLQTATQARELSFTHQSALRDFLAQSDLVKFAKYQPSRAEADAAFEAALRFVKETAPLTEPAVSLSHVS